MVPEMSVLPELVAVNEGTLVFPLAPKPIAVLELVQDTLDDDGVTDTVVEGTVVPIQANSSLNGETTGIG